MRFIYSKVFAWFFAILCLTVVIVFFRSQGWFSPVEKLLLYVPRPIARASTAIVYPIRNFIRNIYSITAIVRENGELENQVARLQQEVVGLQHAESENESLKKELGFVEKAPYVLQPCTILALDPEGITNTMVLNCGSNKGIKPGQGVISNGFLVGKIFVAGNETATAKILTNSDLTVDAKLSKNETAGVVRGSFGSGVIMDLIAQTAEVSQGDLVVTAGINDLIPKNILVGEVGDTVSAGNDLFKKVTVRSSVNFKNLLYVFVAK